ncbi:ABC transporter permease [Herbiconiux moechotypicola]|uniref:ABC transporter permease n=1 Tax=Herbiconiux moechotypicola TaxID=637393 RepID=A0ABN3DEH8_9MICO|nr:ABC transporter permease [Herbiconiux moechotypicola]MCS5729289.1 ABC transporter permease [Herbiconiux moechotypicola]
MTDGIDIVRDHARSALRASVSAAGRAKAWIAVSVLVVLVALLVALTTSQRPQAVTVFTLAGGTEAWQLPPMQVPTLAAGWVMTVLFAASAAWTCVRVLRHRPVGRLPLAAVIASGVVAFLVAAGAGQTIPVVGLLSGTLLLSVPLVFGGLSGLLAEKSGVINIAIEGQLLAGAFSAAVATSLTGNVFVGLAAAAAAGVLTGVILASFSIDYLVNQIVVGVVINVLISGVTTFVYNQVLVPDGAVWNTPERLPDLSIPVLSDIPVIGPVLFDQSLIVYAMYLAVAVIAVALTRTSWGLRVRAVGEHPLAADTMGINVTRVRWRNVLLSGLLAGFGGAFFTIGSVGAFTQDMTAGQGYIALAALIFGRWKPLGVLSAALLFAFANSIQQTLSTLGLTAVPQQLLLTIPYVVTVIAVCGFAGKVTPPAAVGDSYGKGI